MRTPQLIISLISSAVVLASAIAYAKLAGRNVGAVRSEGPAVSAVTNQGALPVSPMATVAGVTNKAGFSWRDVESEDYHKYIANLRAVGCPEQTIRDLIISDVNKLYAARENPLKNKPAQPPGAPDETPEQKLDRLRQLRTVQQEKRWVIKELLGVDVPLDLLPSSGSRDYHAFEVAFGYLPPDKRDAVQQLQESYWQQSDALKTKYDKKKSAESQAEARQLRDSLRQELAKVLTLQELEDYDMRTSATAKQLSDKLSSYFAPSEDEFRKIYRAKRDYEDAVERIAAASSPTPLPADPAERQAVIQQRAAEQQAQQQARTAAQNQMNEQLKSTLGDDRYNEYERSQDRTYDLLARLGVRYGLSQDTVLQAYNLQKSFQPVAPDQGGQVDRAVLQRQLNDQLTAILGEQAARGYRRVQGGSVKLK